LEEALGRRPFLEAARRGDIATVEAGLDLEEKHERAADREYWKPLREELAALRRARLK
jgi:hypothetical protein